MAKELSAAEKAAQEKEQAATNAAKQNQQVSKTIATTGVGVQNIGTVGSASKTNDLREVKRPAPIDPSEAQKNNPHALQVGAGFGNNPNEDQVTTGTLLVDPADKSVHVEQVDDKTVTLAVTPGPQAYSQVLRTAEPNVTGDSRLTLVKIKYPADYEGPRYFADDVEVEMAPETAWHAIHNLKIATEVKK